MSDYLRFTDADGNFQWREPWADVRRRDNAKPILQSGNQADPSRKVPARKVLRGVPKNAADKRGVDNSPRTAHTAGGATQEVDAPMSDQLTAAAREALAAHDALRATDATEPKGVDESSPADEREAWLTWHSEIRRPAFARWQAAMDALDAANGEPVGRHPFTFRPICEEIIRGR